MKRLNDAYMAHAAEIVFHPALTPMEAAMLPAQEPSSAGRPRRTGALSLARASFAPGKERPRMGAYMPKLRGWGPQRQKI